MPYNSDKRGKKAKFKGTPKVKRRKVKATYTKSKTERTPATGYASATVTVGPSGKKKMTKTGVKVTKPGTTTRTKTGTVTSKLKRPGAGKKTAGTGTHKFKKSVTRTTGKSTMAKTAKRKKGMKKSVKRTRTY